MKNNKGFTLVELLAVIVILSSVALVTVASVTASLERREEKECQEQISIAKNAAKIYFSLNNVKSVCVKKLQDEGYFNGTKKIDRLKIDDTQNVNQCTNSKITFNDSTGYTYSNENDLSKVCNQS